jgi:hypothetical protein
MAKISKDVASRQRVEFLILDGRDRQHWVESRQRKSDFCRRRLDMPKFITIGYGDRDGYDRTDVTVRDAAHAHDARLRKAGILMGVAGTPVQVRNSDAKNIETKTGSFMSSSLPLAGFAVIEAATLADAVNLVSQTPCAVANGVVEVWPLNQTE